MPIRRSRNCLDNPPPNSKESHGALSMVSAMPETWTVSSAWLSSKPATVSVPSTSKPPGCEPAIVDAYSNVIEDDGGTAAFRLVALVDVTAHEKVERDELEKRIREKDTLLREIQHRVKNNLQMITALIRLEARNVAGGAVIAPFDRLAGRIESV